MYNAKANFRTIGGLMEDILNNGWGKNFYDEYPARTIPVNIKETDAAYELHVVAPGLNKEDFKLSVDKDILTISFEKAEENKEQTDKWLRKEYKARSFKRSFTLTDKINADAITAKYNDGILLVNLPKKEQAEKTTKEITVG
jgi:HSP20 family protein